MALTNLVTSLVLDVYDHDTTPTSVKAIALDKQTRFIKATLTYRGADYPVDENATVTLTVIRPDKTGVQVTGSVVDVDNADRTGTIKGVSAELSQTALAVKGNLKAQFMVSVGDQILRTEIFAIKNGEALDADVSEWAGEYQGYNLDELVQDVADAKAAVSEMESDVSDLKEGLSAMSTATASDVGKALKAKTVTDGKVTEWEFGEAGGTASDPITDVTAMADMTDTDKLYRYNGSIYYYNGTEWTEVGSGGEGGDISDLENLVNSMNNFGSVSEDVDLTSSLLAGKYYNTKGGIGSTVNTTPSDFANTNCGYWQVSAGDQFVVTGKGGDGSRIWCFTDSEYKILSHANANETLTSETLTASADGYLFVNVYNSQARQVIRKVVSTVTLHDKMDEVEGDIDAAEARFDNLPKWLATNILSGNPAWGDSDLTATGTGASESISSSSASISSSVYSLDGDVIYLSAMVKASGNPTKLSLLHKANDLAFFETAIQNIPIADTWYRLSSIDRQVSASVYDYNYVNIRAYYADSTAQNGQTLTYKCGLAFNLTTIFGKGNEPTDPAVIDAMLSQYENGWFSGSQDIWNPSIIKWLAESYKSYMNGTYYGSDGKRFTAGSIIDRYDAQWDHAQAEYGMSKNLVPVDNKFEGGIRTNGMVNVFPKYGRWERGAAGATTGSLFGGHVFEAWNNIRSYRLTMMMGHGGDEVSYTDENNVVHKTPREDEACIIVYSPANSYANPPVTPTEEQSKLRINKAQEDYYGDSSVNMLGRVRIGGDTPTQGTVFTKNKMITYGRIILADTSQTNKGKQLVFNNDGTITWTEVDLYQHPEPAPTE